MLEKIREYWGSLIAFGVWIAGSVGAFLAVPPALTGTEVGMLKEFAIFVSAGLAGLLLTLTFLFKSRVYARFWGAMAVTTFFLFVGFALTYIFLLDSWTFSYEGKLLVAGTEYQRQILDFIDAVGREPPPEEIVAHFESEPRKVWSIESIAYRKRILILAYVGSIALLTGAVISSAQLCFCVIGKTVPNG